MARYRPGTPDDTKTCFEIFEAAVDDLGRRTGGNANSTADDPAAFETRRPLFDHLASTGDHWWVAEDETTGRAVGYARSIVRDGVRELTEFFVLPDAQSARVGRGLLERAFPADGARHRAIIATIDTRAIARYLRTGLDARVPIIGWEGTPRDEPLASDLAREAIDPENPPLAALAAIDRRILDFSRDVDHRWLAAQRPGWLYRRDGSAVAYGYGPSRPGWGGPYAALEPTDLPVLLADGEATAAQAGHSSVTFDTPMIGRAAIDHLLGRGLRVDPFVMLFFTDGPVDGLDRYVVTSPPFFA
ncbi:MAG TPA: GNAT family N-acetyltransferase [Candidatus Limnocylindrales bacterium]|nr:GNAT family N-acetyltransferase [Candidatus Limnocylindrales bacterium]